jgi:hypothetical protein
MSEGIRFCGGVPPGEPPNLPVPSTSIDGMYPHWSYGTNGETLLGQIVGPALIRYPQLNLYSRPTVKENNSP